MYSPVLSGLSVIEIDFMKTSLRYIFWLSSLIFFGSLILRLEKHLRIKKNNLFKVSSRITFLTYTQRLNVTLKWSWLPEIMVMHINKKKTKIKHCDFWNRCILRKIFNRYNINSVNLQSLIFLKAKHLHFKCIYFDLSCESNLLKII